MIEDINWNYLAKNYGGNVNGKNVTAYDKVKDYCLDNFTINETILVYNFIVEKREELKEFILKYQEKIKCYLSDDILLDLCSHIIGLGESMYDLVKTDPTIIKNISPYVVENFEYGFTAAIYEFHLSNDDDETNSDIER